MTKLLEPADAAVEEPNHRRIVGAVVRRCAPSDVSPPINPLFFVPPGALSMAALNAPAFTKVHASRRAKPDASRRLSSSSAG